MNRILLLICIFIIINTQFSFAQNIEDRINRKSSPFKNHWFLAIGGGSAFQNGQPSYSISSQNLNNSSAYNRSPYLFGKVGFRFHNKHQAALILEKTVASNSFTFWGDHKEGFGVNRGIDYFLGNFEYGYNLLNMKRFWFGPSIQLGIGVGITNSSDFFELGKEGDFKIPDGYSYHKYNIVNHSIPSHIYNIGLGTNLGMEVIDSRLTVGLDIRWLYSLNSVHKYNITYQYNTETLDFTVHSPLSNINLGVKFAYHF